MHNISSCGFTLKSCCIWFSFHDNPKMVTATLKIEYKLQFDVILKDVMNISNTGFIIHFISIIKKHVSLEKNSKKCPKPLQVL